MTVKKPLTRLSIELLCFALLEVGAIFLIYKFVSNHDTTVMAHIGAAIFNFLVIFRVHEEFSELRLHKKLLEAQQVLKFGDLSNVVSTLLGRWAELISHPESGALWRKLFANYLREETNDTNLKILASNLGSYAGLLETYLKHYATPWRGKNKYYAVTIMLPTVWYEGRHANDRFKSAIVNYRNLLAEHKNHFSETTRVVIVSNED